MLISKKISLISPSATLAITAKAKKMKSEGINVIGFGAGEPDFDTPINIKQAAKKAIDNGFTKYTPASGIKELKEAICGKLKKDNNLDYIPEEIIVSCGAKHSIFNAIMALCNEEDEVIIPSPYWVSYPEMVKVTGAKSIFIKTTQDSDFKITPQQLLEAITPKTKLLILNSPSNPTGMVYTKEELLSLSKILIEKNIFCISDEIYEKIIYDNLEHISIASFNSDIKKLTLVINGFSKSYSMTGWRLGYAAGPKEIIKAMSNLQGHSTSNPTSISQIAGVEALNGSQENLKQMVKEFEKRRDYMVGKINSTKHISVIKPQGAFYCFANISEIIGRILNGKIINNSLELTELLLTDAKVAVIPGYVFGDDNFIRLSYANSMEDITEGLNRIEKFINKITK
ncbi:MAG: pyridoxal phosphate-dependent aminotransferase [Candidatus Omnitrophica bacterium]|nr:pyridoxal phosphate-dependent aminotransferase [Candidatus Omnitrophota bacterium]MBU1048311.1 pyridoxal phosphate-dependent aminotransferase [Candidatus Omnitrophota bacterium]MBU1630278.1 pyridoxal phosphate-dependent aminotransferase [Candidatus Omnitrophota bacterium]MBU1766533.1 pyridoxal phosphate-dependent aminotransferase [Candidatus Omnitrophota bacterium]MBU1889707.1 pyridoxal phosphate-dependent aminotransferase [Candidatus Omnitrophota bacterium]